MQRNFLKVMASIIIAGMLSYTTIVLYSVSSKNGLSKNGWIASDLPIVFEGSYADALRATLAPHVDMGISMLKITFTKKINGDYLSQFLLISNIGDYYEGAFSAHTVYDSGWKIDYAGFTPVAKNIPFTLSERGGIIKDTNEYYVLISGVINEKSIVQININYSNGLTVKATVNSAFGTYACLLNKLNGIQNIQGLSKNDQIIFQYKLSH